MLVVIVNHAHTAQTLSLRQRFPEDVEVLAIDSGSDLTDAERGAFDLALPNVYYGGLINAAGAQLTERGAEALLFITSDVQIADPAALVARAQAALAHPGVGVYGPSSWGSGHPQMHPRSRDALREVVFVEGFCFAVTAEVFREVYPVDVDLNRMGWGIDLHLGHAAYQRGLTCVVDDGLEVEHPMDCGYDTRVARAQYLAYLEAHGLRRFHRLVDLCQAKRAWGLWLLRRIYRPRGAS